MKKRILLAMLLATTSLLVACGSTSNQGTQEVQDPIEDVQESIEVVEEPIEEEQTSNVALMMLEYIPWDERINTFYKPYFNRIGYVYGSIEDDLDDDLSFEAFEEYSTSPLPSGEEKLLVNYTNANGVKGAIRFDGTDERKDWTFDSISIYDNNIMYLPNGLDKPYEQLMFGVFGFSELSTDTMFVKDCTNDDALKTFTSWFPLNGDSYRFTPNKDMEHTIDVGDNYAKITYRTDYDILFSQDGVNYSLPYTSYTCVYDDYENEKRYIVVYGQGNVNYTKVLRFMDSIEFIDEEHLPIQNTFYWEFPEGMQGYTQKSQYENGMSRNITSYTTPDNHEMVFHWYGPNDLASQASEENGVLTLQESEGLYKLNVQAILASDIVDMNDINSYGLMEHEHPVEGCAGVRIIEYDVELKDYRQIEEYGLKVEDYSLGEDVQVDDYGTQILYPIVDDNGYKGYATLLYGSDYTMPQDYLYFFTYVEREDVYDDERALEVMASLDYHLEDNTRQDN